MSPWYRNKWIGDHSCKLCQTDAKPTCQFVCYRLIWKCNDPNSKISLSGYAQAEPPHQLFITLPPCGFGIKVRKESLEEKHPISLTHLVFERCHTGLLEPHSYPRVAKWPKHVFAIQTGPGFEPGTGLRTLLNQGLSYCQASTEALCCLVNAHVQLNLHFKRIFYL